MFVNVSVKLLVNRSLEFQEVWKTSFAKKSEIKFTKRHLTYYYHYHGLYYYQYCCHYRYTIIIILINMLCFGHFPVLCSQVQ